MMLQRTACAGSVNLKVKLMLDLWSLETYSSLVCKRVWRHIHQSIRTSNHNHINMVCSPQQWQMLLSPTGSVPSSSACHIPSGIFTIRHGSRVQKLTITRESSRVRIFQLETRTRIFPISSLELSSS